MPGTSIALTIAGSDSGGGAGIQADLKTFSALGVYGASVVTAITAQNTCAVTAVAEVAPAMVAAQLDAVLADIRVDAVKVGMLFSPAIVAAVAAGLRRVAAPVVVDPVMVAKSGDALLQPPAVVALVDEILPSRPCSPRTCPRPRGCSARTRRPRPTRPPPRAGASSPSARAPC